MLGLAKHFEGMSPDKWRNVYITHPRTTTTIDQFVSFHHRFTYYVINKGEGSAFFCFKIIYLFSLGGGSPVINLMKSWLHNMWSFLKLITMTTFGSTPDPGGRPYGDITCSTLKMDITIEFLVIKIPRVSIFSNLCRFATEFFTLATFGSTLDSGGDRMTSSRSQIKKWRSLLNSSS